MLRIIAGLVLYLILAFSLACVLFAGLWRVKFDMPPRGDRHD